VYFFNNQQVLSMLAGWSVKIPAALTLIIVCSELICLDCIFTFTAIDNCLSGTHKIVCRGTDG